MSKLLPIIVSVIGLAVFGFLMFNKPQDNVQKADNSLTLPENTDKVAESEQTAEAENKVVEKKVIQKMEKPEMTIDQSKTYIAVLETSEGTITIKLNADKTPITVNNFVYLANSNFYDNTIFHRVITGFMIQGGDPEGTGRGGPGYKFDDEPFEGEYSRGVVAMANSGPNTNGSQFFIMHKDYQLPPDYVIFGEVLEGLESVDKIAEAEVAGDSPLNPVTITSITIIEK